MEIRKNGDADPWKQYVYHPHYVDAIAVRYYDANTDGQNIAEHYYLQDANFNVTAVTDSAGTVVERYAYTPYGAESYPLAENTYLFYEIFNGTMGSQGICGGYSRFERGTHRTFQL